MAKEIDFPPVWLAAFGALGGLVGRLWPISFPYHTEIGAILVIFGLLLIGIAVLQMMIARTTIMPRRESTSLITGGIFRLTRNPIYLGDALVLAGLLVHWQSALALPLVPIFMGVIYRRFITREEAILTRDYGVLYTEYAARTRRWI